jgi:multiple sugar transport system permease protein
MRVQRDPSWLARLVVHGLVWAGALTMVLPFGWMVSTALKTRGEATEGALRLLPSGAVWEWAWTNFADAWQAAELEQFYLNSVIVAVVVTVVSVFYNALAGYAFAKLRFRGRQVTFGLTLLTMMLPYQVYFIFAYILCTWLGYIDNYQALIVPFLASAFGIFYMRQVITGIPDELIDAGRVDGMTYFEIFQHVVLPAARGGLGALAIFTFMTHWNSFFWPLIVIDSEGYKTLPLAVAELAAGTYVDSFPAQMAAATIITVPMIVVYLVFERQFVRGIALTGLKG